jgi:soluble P-type ATPase
MQLVSRIMLKIEIPQRGTIELLHAVFDVDGTLSVDGVALPEVAAYLKRVAGDLSIHLLTAGTHSNTVALEQGLGFPLRLMHTGEEKMRYVHKLGPANVIAFGSVQNDSGMLRLAAIGIVIVTTGGIATRTLQAADILVANPLDALGLLLQPKRLIATLRN